MVNGLASWPCNCTPRVKSDQTYLLYQRKNDCRHSTFTIQSGLCEVHVIIMVFKNHNSASSLGSKHKSNRTLMEQVDAGYSQ